MIFFNYLKINRVCKYITFHNSDDVVEARTKTKLAEDTSNIDSVNNAIKKKVFNMVCTGTKKSLKKGSPKKI